MHSRQTIEEAVLRAAPIRKWPLMIHRSLINDLDLTECWPWQGRTGADGYTSAGYPGSTRTNRAHRVVWEVVVGPIPAGHQIDHLCHDPAECPGGRECLHRRCVNPNHLEAVPAVVNILRSTGPSAANAVKTHCKRGHEFTSENIIPAGKGGLARQCRTCNTLRLRERRAAQGSRVRQARRRPLPDEQKENAA